MTLKVSYKEVSKEFNISLVKVYKEYAATGMTAEAGSFQPNNNTEGNGNLALDNNLIQCGIQTGMAVNVQKHGLRLI